MLTFEIPIMNQSANQFISLMLSYSGLLHEIPTEDIRDFDRVLVSFIDNTISCLIEIDNDVYNAQWDGKQQAFVQYVHYNDNMDGFRINGFIDDRELDQLFNLIYNGKAIVKGNQKIERTRTQPYKIICTNGTVETIFAKNTYFGRR